MKSLVRASLLSAALATLASVSNLSHAQTTAPSDAWPQRSVRVVVPFPPGGGTDAVARAELQVPQVGGALGRHLAYTSCTECHAWDLNGWEGDPAPSLVVAKAYTLEQFTRLMRTGEIAAGGKSKTGMMSGVAAYRYPVMTDEEIAALKLFLDSR